MTTITVKTEPTFNNLSEDRLYDFFEFDNDNLSI